MSRYKEDIKDRTNYSNDFQPIANVSHQHFSWPTLILAIFAMGFLFNAIGVINYVNFGFQDQLPDKRFFEYKFDKNRARPTIQMSFSCEFIISLIVAELFHWCFHNHLITFASFFVAFSTIKQIRSYLSCHLIYEMYQKEDEIRFAVQEPA